MKFHIASEIRDGFEEVWVTSDTSTILLTIDILSGTLRNFSCRLGQGVVAEMGPATNVLTNESYPTLYVFCEQDDIVTDRLFFRKIDGKWIIET